MSTTASAKPTIINFTSNSSGHNLKPWLKSCRSYLVNSEPTRPFGIAGTVLLPEEYAATFTFDGVVPAPWDEPVAPVPWVDGGTQLAHRIHQDEVAAYNKYRNIKAQTGIDMLESLPQQDRDNLEHPDTGHLTLTPRAIWLYMKATYSITLIHAEILQYSPLDKRFTGADDASVAEFISKMRQCYRLKLSNGHATSQFDQVKNLYDALYGSCNGKYDSALLLFDQALPQSGPARNFEELATRLVNEETRLRATRTTGTQGLGSAAISAEAAEVARLKKELDKSRRALAAMKAGDPPPDEPKDWDPDTILTCKVCAKKFKGWKHFDDCLSCTRKKNKGKGGSGGAAKQDK